jgi:biotin transport system substrate-specific component
MRGKTMGFNRVSAVVLGAPRSRSGLRSSGVLALGIALATLLMAIASKLQFLLPGTPVPVTLQPLVLLLSAGILGATAAAGAMASYVGLGIAGLPMFALGGGLAYIAGPTGGFLVGFVPAAYVAGSLAAGKRSPFAIAAAFAAGAAVLYACGTLHLLLLLGRSLDETIRASVLPFLPGELAKIAVAAAAVAALRSRAARRKNGAPA